MSSELAKAVLEDREIRRRNLEQREARMEKALREGLSISEMRERFGVDEGVVHRLRRRLGIPSPEPIHLSNRYTRLKHRTGNR